MKILLIFILLFPCFCGASTQNIYFDYFLVAVKTMNALFTRYGTPSEIGLHKKISYQFLDTNAELAFSDRTKNGDRVISITGSMIKRLLDLQYAEMHTALIPEDHCFWMYLESSRLGTVKLYLHELKNHCVCSKLNENAILSVPDLKFSIENGLNLNIVFILLHEYAHHYLAHLNTNYEFNINDEIGADSWAIEFFSRIGDPPKPAVVTLAYLMQTESISKNLTKFPSERFSKAVDKIIKEMMDPSKKHLFKNDAQKTLALSVENLKTYLLEKLKNDPVSHNNTCVPNPINDYTDYYKKMHSLGPRAN